MRETTDTNRQFSNSFSKEIPDGEHLLTIKGVERKTKGEVVFYIWKFDMGDQILLPSMMGGLLKVLGCIETEPGKYDWETDAQAGKQVWATVSHALDKKDVMRQHMGKFKPVDAEGMPF